MNARLTTTTLVLGLAAALAACGGGGEKPGAGDSARADTGASAGGMQGMPGMGGMGEKQDSGMMAQMQSHMRLMDGASADSLGAMLPAHRQMVANMLAQMNQEMRSMKMAENSPWHALVDSLRQDLVHMPEMNPTELKAFMPAHRARITRLMEMHSAMMGSMKQ